MINNEQLRNLVIRPALNAVKLYSQEAEDLLVGTCAQESKGGTFIAQEGGGPALGIFQMEPTTHKDIWTRYLSNQVDISKSLLTYCSLQYMPQAEYLIQNMAYAAIMCRLVYERHSGLIPKDLKGQAAYYKLVYNSPLGAATVDEYIANYNAFIGKKVK